MLPEDREAFQVVVYARQDRPVGLIVERILDIVEQDSDVRGPSSRPGVECTAVIQRHITEVLDVEALIGPLTPNPSPPGGEGSRGSPSHPGGEGLGVRGPRRAE
jgi:two-component system chemotaxis sensor kinase CheA